MKRLFIIATLALTGCATDKAATTPTTGPATEAPFASGLRTVSGGEVIALRGATVTVTQVIYVNSPCPEGAKCFSSGIVKQVQFKVKHTSENAVTVAADSTQVLDGIELRVHDVRAGPQADIEVSLPVQPKQ